MTPLTQLRERTVRPHWTYIKTVNEGIVLHTSSETMNCPPILPIGVIGLCGTTMTLRISKLSKGRSVYPNLIKFGT